MVLHKMIKIIFSDSKIYVYNEVLGQVVEHSESVRFELTYFRNDFGVHVICLYLK